VSISLKKYFQYCLEVKIRQLKYVLIICINMATRGYNATPHDINMATCGYDVTSHDKLYHVHSTLNLSFCGEWRTDPQSSTSMEIITTALLFS